MFRPDVTEACCAREAFRVFLLWAQSAVTSIDAA